MDSFRLDGLIAGIDSHAYATIDVAAFHTLLIRAIAYRSDEVTAGSLFFCVPGMRFDGHTFADEAVARGAVALAVEHQLDIDVPQLVFSDTRLALAQVAARFYQNPSADLTIAVVTGTNGKTTTTYLIDWICRFGLAGGEYGDTESAASELIASKPELKSVDQSGLSNLVEPGLTVTVENSKARTGLIGTVETRIGKTVLPSKFTTPESLDLQQLLAQMRDAGVSHVCMEASSHAIALKRIAAVRFAVAAFSNLTQDHLDFHGTMEDYFEAKASLFDSSLVAARAINIDTEYGRRLALRCRVNGFEITTCGMNTDAQIRAEDVTFASDSTSLRLITPEGRFALTYPLIGGFNVSNILLAAASASLLGFTWPQIVGALQCCPQIPGRLERVLISDCAGHVDHVDHADCADRDPVAGTDEPIGQPPVSVFVDYSHTPDSIEKALSALNAIKTNRTLIVFGCGGDRDATKRPLMGKAALAADHIVVTSDNPRSEDPLAIIEDILPGMAGHQNRYEVEPDRRTAIACALNRAEPGDFILIAGKGHEDYQLIGDMILDFDDRVVAAEELRALVNNRRWENDSCI